MTKRKRDIFDPETGECTVEEALRLDEVKASHIDEMRKEFRIRKPYDREAVKTKLPRYTKTLQGLQEEVDVNNIMARFERDGIMPTGRGPGQYGDVTELQKGDLTDRINFSREVLEQAGRDLEEKQLAAQKAQEEKFNAMQKELEQLRAAQSVQPAENAAGSGEG